MKTNRLFSLVAILFLVMQVSFAQKSKNQAYIIHEDQVKPSKIEQYEKAAKALASKMKEHNIQSTNWLAAQTDNFRYFYVTPIEKMADLDENTFKPLVEKMGEENFSKMMSDFDGCYERHGNYVIYMDAELTYMPDGVDQMTEGQNYRKYFYIYVKPEDESAMKEAMLGVKEMFASKNSKSHYRVYRNGFGQLDSYYLVAISSKDPVTMEQQSMDNNALLGPEAKPVFDKVMKLALKFEEYTGYIRPNLSYMPTTDKE